MTKKSIAVLALLVGSSWIALSWQNSAPDAKSVIAAATKALGSPQAAALMDDVMMSVPYGFLRAAAAASDTKVTSKTISGKKYTVLTFTALNKAPASGFLNNQGILERVETKIDNNVLGDIP